MTNPFYCDGCCDKTLVGTDEGLMAYFVGPLYVRLLITEEPVDDAFVDSVIEIGLRGAAVDPDRPRAVTTTATGTSRTSIPEGRTLDSR